MIRRDLLFSTTAVAMLALTIGLNVTVFTVMDAMLFRGFPFVQRSDRLVYLQERSQSGLLCCVSYPDFEDWRLQSNAFDGMSFVASNRPITFRFPRWPMRFSAGSKASCRAFPASRHRR